MDILNNTNICRVPIMLIFSVYIYIYIQVIEKILIKHRGDLQNHLTMKIFIYYYSIN